MMRKRIRQQALELLDTVREAVFYTAFSQGNHIDGILDDCQAALIHIDRIADSTNAAADGRKILRSLQTELKGPIGPDRAEQVVQLVNAAQDAFKKQPVQLEIAFLPYKISMWDCMESVWEAAAADPNCDCYVVPVPYYDRNPDRSLGAMHYEGAMFPRKVCAVDYRSYELAIRRPDIIYIHNPYDGGNLVTSIDPAYYSYQLKKNTDMLVYIPYYISGCVKSLGTGITFSRLSGYQYADYVIAQSEEMKRGFIDLGIPARRVLTLGNPKFDAVLNHLEGTIPESWLPQLQGRTVFLVNTSLTDLLAHNENWLPRVYSLLTGILSHSGCAVIWRPHPLMEATLRSMRPEQYRFYREMRNQLSRADGFVFDQQGEVMPAFRASHALISDYSSIMWQFGVTKKPVLCITGKKSDRAEATYRVLDDSEFYFVHDDVSVEDFIEMVKSGYDPNQEKRLAALERSTSNLDGTAGVKIHCAIMNLV